LANFDWTLLKLSGKHAQIGGLLQSSGKENVLVWSGVRRGAAYYNSSSYWDRGRLARLKYRRQRDAANLFDFKRLFALRAHGGRDARGPSDELEW